MVKLETEGKGHAGGGRGRHVTHTAHNVDHARFSLILRWRCCLVPMDVIWRNASHGSWLPGCQLVSASGRGGSSNQRRREDLRNPHCPLFYIFEI
ncbi:hypothetical protein E2C01_011367 [Portunus trituberculatus]|uniref:Uncharacterized protein n=1 Tax=Portunus trituberculatus TaxID=210409 RepID=A0A5B7DB08_PORTR|nr:hypothetical protein [Portunus trituberculatus]